METFVRVVIGQQYGVTKSFSHQEMLLGGAIYHNIQNTSTEYQHQKHNDQSSGTSTPTSSVNSPHSGGGQMTGMGTDELVLGLANWCKI